MLKGNVEGNKWEPDGAASHLFLHLSPIHALFKQH